MSPLLRKLEKKKEKKTGKKLYVNYTSIIKKKKKKRKIGEQPGELGG